MMTKNTPSTGIDQFAAADARATADTRKPFSGLPHRGAVGADPLMGDGAGILVQVPHAFFSKVLDFALPAAGEYAPIMIFYPNDVALRDRCADAVRACLSQEGLTLLGERMVPFDNSKLSEGVILTQPIIEQMFLARPEGLTLDEFERKLLIVRKVISNTVYMPFPKRRAITAFTSSRCRRARSSIRACSWPTSLAPSTRTSGREL
jgi:glutamate synthase domain-containing protein 1